MGSAVAGCAVLAFAGGLDRIAEPALSLGRHCTPKDMEEGFRTGAMLVLGIPVFLAARMLAASLARAGGDVTGGAGRPLGRLGVALLLLGTFGLLFACVQWWTGLAEAGPRHLSYDHLHTGALFLRCGAIGFLACATAKMFADNLALRAQSRRETDE